MTNQQIKPIKSRCKVCKKRLNLIQITIGKCKCNLTFCSLHRLPEQHQCTFDHKKEGREILMKNAVKLEPEKHIHI